MRSKGLVATLDGLLAYTVAFVCLGMIVALVSETREADIKSMYELNVMAEDLADAIGSSMVNPAPYTQAWLNRTNQTILRDLNTSLTHIASERGLKITVTTSVITNSANIGNPKRLVSPIGDMSDACTIVSAKRLLANVDSGYNPVVPRLSLLNVTIGV